MAAGEVDTGRVGGKFTDVMDDQFVDLLDTTMRETSPVAGRLMAILAERGRKGWTRVERVPPHP